MTITRAPEMTCCSGDDFVLHPCCCLRATYQSFGNAELMRHAEQVWAEWWPHPCEQAMP